MRNRIFSLLLLSLWLPLQSLSQDTNAHSGYDQYIAKALKDYDLPGLSIAIVKDGELVFKNAYGFADIEEKTELNTESVFAIASLSKAFTATAIGILVDEGKIDWNDRVSKYIDGFSLSDEYVASQMTIADLLSHRSGFKTFDGDLLWYSSKYSRDEIVERFQAYPMSYDFRTKYGYQNIMFIIAGEVVEEVSGMSWEAYIKERIFDPLQMDHSYATFDGFKSESNKAFPYTKGMRDEIRSYDNSGGAAAISSNVMDLSNWISMWLNDGMYGEDTIITKGTHRQILEMHTPIPPSSFDKSNGIDFKGYALGWFLMNYNGHKVAHHGGGLPGYISKIFLVPSEGLGGIVLTNGETSLPNALMYRTIDEFEGSEENKDWAATYLSFANRYKTYLEKQEEDRIAKRGKGKANIDKSKLVGTYRDKVYGDSKVEMKDGKLHLRLLPAEDIFQSTMEHWQQNTYKVVFKDKFLPAGYVSFESDANGEVKAFKIDLPNPDFHFHNLDFKKID